MYNTDGWLTGNEIIKQVSLGNITISDFNESNINSNSYNYTLSNKLLRLTNDIVDTRGEDSFEEITIQDTGYTLLPGECYLGSTNEIFGSNVYASLVTGRSSIGRKFITNHITAALIDQGFLGTITLEITVMKPTIVYPGIKFGQIYWLTTCGIPRLYTGKYAGQRGPIPSRIILDTKPNP